MYNHDRARKLEAMRRISEMMEQYEQGLNILDPHYKAPRVILDHVESLVLAAKVVYRIDEHVMQIVTPTLCVDVDARRVAAYYATGMHVMVDIHTDELYRALYREGVEVTHQIPRPPELGSDLVRVQTEFVMSVDMSVDDRPTNEYSICYVVSEGNNYKSDVIITLHALDLQCDVHLVIIDPKSEPYETVMCRVDKNGAARSTTVTSLSVYEECKLKKHFSLLIIDSVRTPMTKLILSTVKYKHYSINVSNHNIKKIELDNENRRGHIYFMPVLSNECRLVSVPRFLSRYNRVSYGSCSACSNLAYVCTRRYTRTFALFFAQYHECPLDEVFSLPPLRWPLLPPDVRDRVSVNGTIAVGFPVYAVSEKQARSLRTIRKLTAASSSIITNSLEIKCDWECELDGFDVFVVRYPVTEILASRTVSWAFNLQHECYYDVLYVNDVKPLDIPNRENMKPVIIKLRILDLSAYRSI